MKNQNANDSLQFDKAEFESEAESQCFACNRVLTNKYFDVNGRTVCERCKNELGVSLKSELSNNTGLALAYGTAAAIVGAIIYFAVIYFTGYEVGLISILVGYLVGKTVFIGSGKRGGKKYQIMAVVLTYLAIASTHLPAIIYELNEESYQTMMVEGEAQVQDQKTVPKSYSLGTYAYIVIIILAMPFLGGFDNIIGLLIIVFGLYQAWSTSKGQPIVVTGPYQIGKAQNKG